LVSPVANQTREVSVVGNQYALLVGVHRGCCFQDQFRVAIAFDQATRQWKRRLRHDRIASGLQAGVQPFVPLNVPEKVVRNCDSVLLAKVKPKPGEINALMVALEGLVQIGTIDKRVVVLAGEHADILSSRTRADNHSSFGTPYVQDQHVGTTREKALLRQHSLNGSEAKVGTDHVHEHHATVTPAGRYSVRR